jgi:DNA-binding transcriptional ArsR family regulator
MPSLKFIDPVFYYSNMRSTTQQLKEELKNNKALELCARQCGIMGDETKLKIRYLLRHHPELSVTNIAELVGTSVSNISHSLNKLRSAQLVRCRKEAQTVYYSLEKDAFANVLSVIGG